MSPPRRPAPPPRGRHPSPPSPNPQPQPSERGWDQVAGWYDKWVGEAGSDYHRLVIIPAALRLLAIQPGESVIDVCCGQGVLVQPLLHAGIGHFTGIDASPRLIASAQSRHDNNPRVEWIIADVCQPEVTTIAHYDAATCLMAVHDVTDPAALFSNMARALKPGGRAVFVLMHPCFRIPRTTHWGWDADQKIQYRRIDGYRSPLAIPITTHPGKHTGDTTVFHHRPLAELLSALGSAGLAVVASEELYSHRRSQASGPFSKAEHRAAEEIPMFLALKAVRA